MLSKEQQMLIEAEYYNPISIGDYSFNVHDFGKKMASIHLWEYQVEVYMIIVLEWNSLLMILLKIIES